MNEGEDDNGRQLCRQVSQLQPAKVDAKPTAKTEDQERENTPEIKQNEIEFEGSGDAETAIILTERDAIGNSGENKAHQRPPKEKDCQSGPLRFELTHSLSRESISK
jgi:hypothetical protein